MTRDDFHPIAQIFPMMNEAAVEQLSADIKENGQREPIWTHQGKIIDGRNRFIACENAGIKPIFQEWDGAGDLTAFVISLNLHRRHLSESQRALIASEIANSKGGGNRKSDHLPNLGGDPEITNARAAELLNISHNQVSKARVVRSRGTAAQVASIETGKKTLDRVYKEIKEQSDAFISDAPLKALEAAEKDKPREALGRGITAAHNAINILKRIPPNDALRAEGLRTVAAWIRDNK